MKFCFKMFIGESLCLKIVYKSNTAYMGKENVRFLNTEYDGKLGFESAQKRLRDISRQAIKQFLSKLFKFQARKLAHGMKRV